MSTNDDSSRLQFAVVYRYDSAADAPDDLTCELGQLINSSISLNGWRRTWRVNQRIIFT